MAYRFFTSGGTNDNIEEHEAPTPYSLTGATNNNSNLTDATNLSNVDSIQFSPNGRILIVSLAGSSLRRWDLATAWDVSTGTDAGDSFDVQSTFGLQSRDMVWKPDGTRCFLSFATGAEYRWADAGTPWSPSTLPAVGSWSTAQEFQTGFHDGIKFNPDGTIMYIAEFNTQDRVQGWSLATAWDPSSTATLDSDYSLTTSAPAGFAFAPDGTKLFVAVYNVDDVYEYNLPTPWSLTGATFVQAYTGHVGTDIEGIWIQDPNAEFRGWGIPV